MLSRCLFDAHVSWQVLRCVVGRYSDVSSSVCVISSKSSPLLTAHQPSAGSRSRHSSPVNDSNNVIAWLKEIRLHKYSECLAKFTWDEVT